MKTQTLTRAFTMIELVFVIIVIGIISALAIPRFDRNNLREAADQLVSHIRYTQHLAMQDNKFDPSNADWFRSRWQIRFHRTVDTVEVWSYSIFSDRAGYSGEPDEPELATNPTNAEQYLTGGFSGGVITLTSPKRLETMALGEKYGITGVLFSATCSNNTGINQSRRLSFDSMGRVFQGDMSNVASWTDPYQADKIIQAQCTIQLSTDSDTLTIAIEPETGYTHIL